MMMNDKLCYKLLQFIDTSFATFLPFNDVVSQREGEAIKDENANHGTVLIRTIDLW